jgi:hypothetical protein
MRQSSQQEFNVAKVREAKQFKILKEFKFYKKYKRENQQFSLVSSFVISVKKF